MAYVGDISDIDDTRVELLRKLLLPFTSKEVTDPFRLESPWLDTNHFIVIDYEIFTKSGYTSTSKMTITLPLVTDVNQKDIDYGGTVTNMNKIRKIYEIKSESCGRSSTNYYIVKATVLLRGSGIKLGR